MLFTDICPKKADSTNGTDPHEWNYGIEPENSQKSHVTVGTLFSHTVNATTDVQTIC